MEEEDITELTCNNKQHQKSYSVKETLHKNHMMSARHQNHMVLVRYDIPSFEDQSL